MCDVRLCDILQFVFRDRLDGDVVPLFHRTRSSSGD